MNLKKSVSIIVCAILYPILKHQYAVLERCKQADAKKLQDLFLENASSIIATANECADVLNGSSTEPLMKPDWFDELETLSANIARYDDWFRRADMLLWQREMKPSTK